MSKSKKLSKDLQDLPVKDFVDMAERLWIQKKADDLLEKRLDPSEKRFLEDHPQFTVEEVIEEFKTPM